MGKPNLKAFEDTHHDYRIIELNYKWGKEYIIVDWSRPSSQVWFWCEGEDDEWGATSYRSVDVPQDATEETLKDMFESEMYPA